jgi:hypothetical protein
MTNAVIGRSQAADIGLRHSSGALDRAHVVDCQRRISQLLSVLLTHPHPRLRYRRVARLRKV